MEPTPSDRLPPAETLGRLIAGRNLSERQAYAIATQIMEGALTPVQIGALLVALSIKGEGHLSRQNARVPCPRLRGHV